MTDEQAIEARTLRLRADMEDLRAQVARLVEGQCALTLRAEQAERERDEARRIHAANVEAGIELAKEFNRVGGIGVEVDGVFRRARVLVALFVENKAARERAEADNAALRAMLEKTGRHIAGCSIKATGYKCIAECGLDAVLLADHPGAALLEYIRALEKVREACEPWMQRYARVGKPPHTHEGVMLAACAAADALRAKR